MISNLGIIIGTRPQILKSCLLINELTKNKKKFLLIHTGQHYDNNLSDIHFNVLNIKKPDIIIKNKGNTSIEKFSHMMINLENVLVNNNINKVIIFGDCDTTLAGALVAKRLGIFIIHIESGSRSYNKLMPEETNRLLTEKVSNILLCSAESHYNNLLNENVNDVFYVGNLQVDLLNECCKKYNNKEILEKLSLIENEFVILTIHRDYNSNEIIYKKLFNELSRLDIKIIFLIHPKAHKILNNIVIPNNIHIHQSIDYLNMSILMRTCKYIITDSGGIQPEAYFLKKKCILIRKETGWIDYIKTNNNILYYFNEPLKEFIQKFLKIKIKNNVVIKMNSFKNIYNILYDKNFII